MAVLQKVRHNLTGVLGKWILWMWAKSARTTVLGEERYRELRREKKPVIILIWHGRIFFAPYFFRRRGIMPLVSPSEDGEILARIIARWGYKIIRGSSSHNIVKAWNHMIKELKSGGELIIVPDGPRGPAREMKPGAVKLAKETGAFLVPFTFSSSRRKSLRSWDAFLIPRPFTRFVAIYGKPFTVESSLSGQELDKKNREVEAYMRELDRSADSFFD